MVTVENRPTSSINTLAVFRGEDHKEISALIQSAETSSAKDLIWVEVENELARLYTTHPIRDLKPHQVIESVRASESSSFISVGASIGKRHADIGKYRKITSSVLAFVLQKAGLLSETPATVNQLSYEQLRLLHEEADTIAQVVADPKIRCLLKSMPDLNALLSSFKQHSTVKNFLDTNRVPYIFPKYVANYNADLRDFLFGQKPPRLGIFLRKATFARWVHGNTNWHNSDSEDIDRHMAQCAIYAYTNTSPKEKSAEARYIKKFLYEVIINEYTDAIKDIDLREKNTFNNNFLPTFFISTNGQLIQQPSDIDVAKTLELFAEEFSCPETFTSLVKKYVGSSNPLQIYDPLAEDMYNHTHYAFTYKKQWLSGGFTFLENSLLLKPNLRPKDNYRPTWESLTVDRRKELRRFRQVFQTVLKEQQR